MRILAADIGGTKTLAQLLDVHTGGIEILAEARFDSAHYDDPALMFEDLARRMGCVAAACFGVAGPVSGNREHQTAQITNLPWHMDNRRLAQRLGIAQVRLINDFQAIGYALDRLKEKDLVVLQAGVEHVHGVRALIGAGTGLGEGYLVWGGEHYEVLASEGGHVDFAPTDDLQIGLLQFLTARFGRVSYERLLSGPGLVNIYTFLRQRAGTAESLELAAAMADGDCAAAIAEFALWRSDKLAQQALEMFVKIYGAQTGNLALATLARGGVYIAGGIAPKIIDALHTGIFMEAFNAKGRMQPLLQAIPVKVILNPKAGLIGAAVAASRLKPSV